MMDVKVIGIKLNIKKWLPFMLIIVVVFMSVTGCNSYTADKKKESVNNKDTSTPVIIEHENSSEKQEGEVSEKNLSEGSTETVVIEKNKATSVEIKAQAEIIESWTWERDDNVTYIDGSIRNTGSLPIGFFRIRAEYVDADGSVIDSDIAVYGEVVWPGHQKKFKITNLYESSQKSVRIWIDQLDLAEEPVIHKGVDQNAEIVNGWTWDKRGQFTYINGSLSNTGNANIGYYKIIAEYLDENDQVLDSQFTNSNDLIKPGQISNFEIMHRYDIEYQSVTIYISVLD